MFVDKAPSFGGADAARRSASPLEDAARIFKEGEIRNSTRKAKTLRLPLPPVRARAACEAISKAGASGCVLSQLCLR